MLNKARELHQDDSRWPEAASEYRRVIKQRPQHADALHHLGALLVQMHGKEKVSR